MAPTPPDRSWKRIHEVLSALLPLDSVRRVGRGNTAKELGITKQALHKRLGVLADVVRVEQIEQLITSGHESRQELTETGKAIARLWSDVESRTKRFLDELDQNDGSAILRLVILDSIWEGEGSWLKQSFRASMPGVSLQATAVVAQELDQYILKGDADVAIGYPPRILHSDLVSQHWGDEDLVFVISPKYYGKHLPNLFMKSAKASQEDIRRSVQKKFYVMSKGGPLNDLVLPYLKECGITSEKLEERPSVSEAMLLVDRGDGVSILPKESAMKEKSNRGLDNVSIVPLSKPLSRQIEILYRGSMRSDAALRAFLDCIHKHKNPYRS